MKKIILAATISTLVIASHIAGFLIRPIIINTDSQTLIALVTVGVWVVTLLLSMLITLISVNE
jgi:hypothetical protein